MHGGISLMRKGVMGIKVRFLTGKAYAEIDVRWKKIRVKWSKSRHAVCACRGVIERSAVNERRLLRA